MRMTPRLLASVVASGDHRSPYTSLFFFRLHAWGSGAQFSALNLPTWSSHENPCL
jgi:hypothetical protein